MKKKTHQRYDKGNDNSMTNFKRITKSASNLAEFINQVRDCCYNMARYGAMACEECPLKDACEIDNTEEWLEAKEGGE